MEPQLESPTTVWPFPFSEQDWEQTPPAVQAYLHPLRHERDQLQDQAASLAARLHQDATNSSRSPSSDSPYKNPRRRTGSSPRTRKGGGKPGHPGHRQVLLAPTSVEDLLPALCACGSGEFGRVSPDQTHQVIELPRIEMEVSHWVLHPGQCVACGRWCKASVPAEQTTGYGPRLSALLAELAGTYGTGRRMVQTFCSSGLGVPISLGAIQNVLDRVTQAIDPHDALMATPARQAAVNYIDETPWQCENALEWLWVMASEQVAFYMSHARRSKEAFFDLILRSDGWLMDGQRISPQQGLET